MACNFWTITVIQARNFGAIVPEDALGATDVDAARRVAVGAATAMVPVAATAVSVDAVDWTVVVDLGTGNTALALRGGLTAVAPEVEPSVDDDIRGTAGDGFADESVVDELDLVDRDTAGFFAADLDVFEIGV